jgi:NADPH-dependent ferric siderophore reductase
MTVTLAPPAVRPYQPFPLRVARTSRLSTSFLRVTLQGPALDDFAAHGLDQRVNLVFLPPSEDFDSFAGCPDWLERARTCGAALRAYTVRAFRPEARELDVDFVLHGSAASAWATAARPGDRAMMIGATHGHPVTDVGWKPPATATRLLLAADCTALPAAASILESLDRPATAVIEVPEPDDRMPLRGDHDIVWRVRSWGETVEPAVRALLTGLAPGGRPASCGDLDPADGVWEVPENATGGFYAWLAGESGAVVSLRRHLVGERGLDRRSVAFMGYWKRQAG